MCERHSYAPFGKTPERHVASRREGLSVMSTATNRFQVRWKVFEGAMNADILLDFLKRLMKDMRSKKVFLIFDNLKVHHAKPVTAWLTEHVDEIEVFYLPSYSPELNFDEMLNDDRKANVTKQAPNGARSISKKRSSEPSTSSPEITTTCRSLFHTQTNSLCSLSQAHVFLMNNRGLAPTVARTRQRLSLD